jgi:hypothetical protein
LSRVAIDPAADPERVLAAFMKDGRIVQIPRQPSKRRVLLDVLAQQFDIGVRYSETEVNDTLGRFHPDVAAWRRYLVDEGFMDRDAETRLYWRSGGTVRL